MSKTKCTSPKFTYDQRRSAWVEHEECPYCKSKKILVEPAKRGGKHCKCLNELCGAENYLSRRDTA